MPRKVEREMPRYLASDGDFLYGKRGIATEAGAQTAASNAINRQGYRDIDVIGIYKLVKIVRRKVAPVEVEAVSF